MGTLVIEDALIFDSSGRQPFRGTVVVKDNVIEDVGTRGEVSPPEGARVVEARGMFLMPGLIDAHLHLTGSRSGRIEEDLVTPIGVFFARAVRDLEALADAGFTTVVDAGSIVGLHLRDAVAEGTVRGPRVVAAGPVLSQTFGHADVHYLPVEWVDYRTTRKLTPFASLICDGEAECRKAARHAMREGADFIKVMASGGVLSQRDRPEYRQFTLEELKAIVDEARAANRWVHAHAEGKAGIVNAARAGVKIVAHCDMMDEEAAEEVLKAGATCVPTFAIDYRLLEEGQKLGVPEWGMRKIAELADIHLENIRRAYRMGVRLATGTDFSGGVGRHGENAEEVAIFVEKVGMTPQEALIAATRNAAYAAGLEGRAGIIAKGALADLILVDGNPLDNVRALTDRSRVKLVVRGGEVIKDLTTRA
ncbi:amidohydrolase [Acidilobus saccharovorans 345-15]|uniref:Amidohydrolase n=1 Tax=Acidilobus saccharovorans (strain DSM 16705 / JCM 18335 / VKM B-2471 / 345-15) TaxID=666510 RepID=D9Q1C2_ACIS3|nr:amidohydrolase family protein [Acidilobus saccharovorans]ADL19110.1 amidohydrolase [Acidilobus saccharovorans 345-15]